jgi:uncharacterized protein YndB with AHSA1/START domain
MVNTNACCAEAQMMIRKPAENVFQALIDPSITRNFWFTKASGRLEPDKEILWEWEMYHVSATVTVREIIPNKKIVFDWGEPPRRVEFTFTSLNNDCTYVQVAECGFDKTGDELLNEVKQSTGGFTTVLDGLKAYLEFGINLNLVADKLPKLPNTE